MRLVDYLTERDESYRDFALRTGIPERDVSKYCRGVCKPRDGRKLTIARATRRKVDLTDWIDGARRRRRPAARAEARP